MVEDNIIQDFVNTIKSDQQENTKTYLATVSRVESDGSVFVRIAGSDIETPTAMTSAEVNRGDIVNVEWRNNKLYIAGNSTNPSVGVVRVEAVEAATQVANEAAANAVQSAGEAHAAAEDAKATAESVHGIAVQAREDAKDAKTAAGTAQTAADTALVNLATTEDVVGVLNWITAHGTMVSQTGGVYVDGQVYFVADPTGDYVVSGTHYSVVAEPKAEDIDTYYILNISESVQNYVATHIVVDTEGLWIIPDAGGNKVLIATGSGSTYTTAGTYIVGKVNGVDAVFAKFTADGATMQRGSTDIAHLGYGQGINSGGGTSDAPYYTLGIRSKATNVYDSTIRYHVGNLVLYGNPQKEYCCKVDIETPEAWTPSHWQLSIGNYSTEEGRANVASGYSSHAEGSATKAFGYEAHSEGSQTIALGDYAHSEGMLTTANGWASHAEGVNTTASGDEAHAEGANTIASAMSSHAEGEQTTASGRFSHAQNERTIAGYDHQTAIGKYNDNQSTNALEIGNGTDINRSNALTVDWSGNVEAAGDVTADGNSILDALYFKPGDTYVAVGRHAGLCTNASKDMQLSLVLPKSAKYCAGFTITNITGGVRISTGGYADNVGDGTSWSGRSGISFGGALYNADGTNHASGDGKDAYMCTVNLAKTSAFKQNGTTTNVVNNTPVTLGGNISIKFN